MPRSRLLISLLLNGAMLSGLLASTILQSAADDAQAVQGRSLAQLTSWVLFSGGRAVRGAPFLAYGYLSHIVALSPEQQQGENESSAVLSFVVEGTLVDFQQNGPAFMVESQGTLRVYFDPHAKRDFTKPDSFRSGEEIAAYDLQRQVLFDPREGTLYDRSFASCRSSKSFVFEGKEVNLLRLWGSQLVLRAQAHASNGLPSPLPDYSGAIPYTGGLFVWGERTDLPPSPFKQT